MRPRGGKAGRRSRGQPQAERSIRRLSGSVGKITLHEALGSGKLSARISLGERRKKEAPGRKGEGRTSVSVAGGREALEQQLFEARGGTQEAVSKGARRSEPKPSCAKKGRRGRFWR